MIEANAIIRSSSHESLSQVSQASTDRTGSEGELKAPTLSEFESLGLESSHDWKITIGADSAVSNAAIALFESRLEALGWSLERLPEASGASKSGADGANGNGYDSDGSFGHTFNGLDRAASEDGSTGRDESKEHCFCEVKTTMTLTIPQDEAAQDDFYGALYDDTPDPSDADYRPLAEIADKEVTQTKTVFAHPKAPLVDLLHEFDHVLQFEQEQAIQDNESDDFDDYDSVPYLYTKLEVNVATSEDEIVPWDEALGRSAESGFEQVFSGAEDRLDGVISSAWTADSGEDINIRLFNHLVPSEIQERRLTLNQNNHAEVNAYERETARYEKLDFSHSETDEIRSRIKDNQSASQLEAKEPLQQAFEFVKSKSL